MIIVPAPDGKRAFSIPTNDPAVARAAVRQRLAQEWMLANKTGKPDRQTAMDTALTGIGNGGTLGLMNVLEGGALAGTAGVRNKLAELGGEKPTFGMYDAYKATRNIQRQQSDQHPILSGVSGLLGGLRMPGMGGVADFVAGKVGAKLAPGLLRNILTSEALPAVTARSAVAGVPLGVVAGAAGAKPGQEVQGAVQGGAVGGAVGAAAPAVTGVAARGAKYGGKVIGTVVGDLARGAANLSGMTRTDTQGVAMKQVVNALRADKATPAQIKQVMNDWLTSGASPPSILDLASKLPNGGGNTRRLIMGASMTDSGSGVAGQYADKVATALPENADRLVRTLTPDENRTAAQVGESLKGRQTSVADEMYPGPYAQQVPVTPEVSGALADQEGAGAIKQAIAEARSRRDYARVDRLTNLLQSMEPPPVVEPPRAAGFAPPPVEAPPAAAAAPPPVTAGDLDRVKINMGEQAANLLRGDNPQRGVASGLVQRSQDIDAALEQVPGLGPARATFKGIQGQRDALDLGKGALDPSGGEDAAKASDDYIAALKEKTGMATPDDNPFPVSQDNIRQAAGVGYRQGASNLIENPAAGSTGVVNRLATSPRQIKIQEATFNPEGTDSTAADMRAGLSNEMLKLQNARRNNPGFGSGSMDRAMSLSELPAIPKTWGHAAMKGLLALHQGAALTDTERTAIVHLGLGDADADGLLAKMHPDVQPILDTIDEYARTLAPTSAAGAASAAAPQEKPKPSGIDMEIEGQPETNRKVIVDPKTGQWTLAPLETGQPQP